MLKSVSRLAIPLHKTRDSLHIIKSLLAVHSGEKIKNIYYNAHSDRPTSDATLAKWAPCFCKHCRADAEPCKHAWPRDIWSRNGGTSVVTSSQLTPHRSRSPPLSQKQTSNNISEDQYSPKSRNCFMERGEGENFEKCSMCCGALATAAFFMINRTNFIVALWGPESTQKQVPKLSYSKPLKVFSCCSMKTREAAAEM